MTVEFEFLKTAGYFSKLERHDLENISPLVFEKKHPSGDIVLWQGDPGEVLYFVISGVVKLFASSPEGREFIVRLVYGGDCLNDEAIFDNGPSELSAMAMSPVVLYGLSRGDLMQILRTYPQVHSSVAEVFAAHQRYLVRLGTELVFKNVSGRLARLLLEREKLVNAGSKEIKITQQEMAFMIGTVREIVSRSLRELDMMGAISLRHNQITITDRNQLLKLSQL